MKPLHLTTCRHALLALAAIAGLFLTAGCGSSSTHTNQQGFGNGSLSGTYVISIAGTDINSSSEVVAFAVVGTIQPNGSGGFSGGTLDIDDPGNTGVNPGQALGSNSSYSVGADGRGTGTLVTPVATLTIDFVLSSTNGGLISLFNNDATGSGTIDLQTATTQASLTSLAFSLSGADTGVNPLAMAGAFDLSGSGAVTSGIEDINDNNSSAQSNGTAGIAISTTSSLVLNSSGTAGTAVINNGSAGFPSLGFDVWVVDSSNLKFIETDKTGNVLSGDAFTQQTTFPAGQVVFTLIGQDSVMNPLVAGGYATADASGDLSAGLEDYNDTTTANTVSPFSASGASSSGRYEVTTTGFTPSTLQFAAYPSSGGVLILENDNEGLLAGAAYAQGASPALNTSGGYALNLTGANNLGAVSPFGEVDDIGQFDPGTPDTSLTGPTNMTGNLDENDLGVGPATGSLRGVYVPDTTSDGRGSISSTNSGTLLGGFDLQYYVVDSSTVLFIDVDSNSVLDSSAAQVALGVFETQSSSSSAAMHKAMFVPRPIIRSHGAMKGGNAQRSTKYTSK